MKTISLNSPKPLTNALEYSDFKYPIVDRFYLDTPTEMNEIDFFSVLLERKTRRDFSHLTLNYLSSLLWYSAHIKKNSLEKDQVPWQHRPVASAGGCHPIDIVIFRPCKKGWLSYIYDPYAHCICSLSISESLIELFLMEIDSVVPLQQATLFWFVAQAGKTLSKYENGDSLVWRDAGVLLGHLTLVAEALGLSCCPVGITGDAELDEILPSSGKLTGMGGCLFGTNADFNTRSM